MTAEPGLTRDGFLGGQIHLLQPREGYRAATDAVFLAAAVAATPGESVLDLGCGVGCAALCLGHRVPGLDITGLEREVEMAELARRNAIENKLPLSVVTGDVVAMPATLRARTFDHVISNPPYFDQGGIASPNQLRDVARRDSEGILEGWIDAAMRRLRPRGQLTLIHLTARMPEIIQALHGRAGGISILPLTSRPGRDAERIILRCFKGSRAPARLLQPFMIHAASHHVEGIDNYSAAARAILRSGEALPI